MPKLENTFYWDRAKGQGGGGMTPEQIAQLNKATSDIANHQQEYNDLVRQVEEVNNETSTNTNDIASIETELNDLTQHITDLETNKLDKSEFNTTISGINEKLDHNDKNIIFLHHSIDNKQDKLIAGDNIDISKNTISVRGSAYEIDGGNNRIIDLGNNKIMVIAEAYISSFKQQGQDLFGALPDEVKNLTNVNEVEYFEYCFIQRLNNKNKIFTNYVGNIAATVYNNRLYLVNETNIAGYVDYLRFKVIYKKTR